MDTRLQGAQNTLLLQEETFRKSERERKTLLDQIAGFERQLAASENEKKQFLVSFFKKNSFIKNIRYIFVGKNRPIKIK